MAQGQKTNRILVPQARAAMDKFKWETARELGLNVQEGAYMGDIPSRQNGSIGGNMVRKMIAQYEQQLAGTTGAAALPTQQTQFQAQQYQNQ